MALPSTIACLEMIDGHPSDEKKLQRPSLQLEFSTFTALLMQSEMVKLPFKSGEMQIQHCILKYKYNSVIHRSVQSH